jgi:serine/threonine protein phosphatase 1
MSASSRRVVAIGDVHGCLHALEALLESVAPASDDTLVFLGDLIDHGRDSRETLQRILALQSQCRVVLVSGNHEEMLMRARDGEQALRYWENHGGASTLSSYRFPGKLADIPEEHWRLIERCVPYYETEHFVFTHANYTPNLPWDQQPAIQLRWALFDPQEMRPHMSGKGVLVGHTEQRQGEILDLGFAMCIDTACWRYGWLTAIEPSTGETWQASKWGLLREQGEETHRERLSVLLGASG